MNPGLWFGTGSTQLRVELITVNAINYLGMDPDAFTGLDALISSPGSTSSCHLPHRTAQTPHKAASVPSPRRPWPASAADLRTLTAAAHQATLSPVLLPHTP